MKTSLVALWRSACPSLNKTLGMGGLELACRVSTRAGSAGMCTEVLGGFVSLSDKRDKRNKTGGFRPRTLHWESIQWLLKRLSETKGASALSQHSERFLLLFHIIPH